MKLKERTAAKNTAIQICARRGGAVELRHRVVRDAREDADDDGEDAGGRDDLPRTKLDRARPSADFPRCTGTPRLAMKATLCDSRGQ